MTTNYSETKYNKDNSLVSNEGTPDLQQLDIQYCQKLLSHVKIKETAILRKRKEIEEEIKLQLSLSLTADLLSSNRPSSTKMALLQEAQLQCQQMLDILGRMESWTIIDYLLKKHVTSNVLDLPSSLIRDYLTKLWWDYPTSFPFDNIPISICLMNWLSHTTTTITDKLPILYLLQKCLNEEGVDRFSCVVACLFDLLKSKNVAEVSQDIIFVFFVVPFDFLNHGIIQWLQYLRPSASTLLSIWCTFISWFNFSLPFISKADSALQYIILPEHREGKVDAVLSVLLAMIRGINSYLSSLNDVDQQRNVLYKCLQYLTSKIYAPILCENTIHQLLFLLISMGPAEDPYIKKQYDEYILDEDFLINGSTNHLLPLDLTFLESLKQQINEAQEVWIDNHISTMDTKTLFRRVNYLIEYYISNKNEENTSASSTQLHSSSTINDLVPSKVSTVSQPIPHKARQSEYEKESAALSSPDIEAQEARKKEEEQKIPESPFERVRMVLSETEEVIKSMLYASSSKSKSSPSKSVQPLSSPVSPSPSVEVRKAEKYKKIPFPLSGDREDSLSQDSPLDILVENMAANTNNSPSVLSSVLQNRRQVLLTSTIQNLMKKYNVPKQPSPQNNLADKKVFPSWATTSKLHQEHLLYDQVRLKQKAEAFRHMAYNQIPPPTPSTMPPVTAVAARPAMEPQEPSVQDLTLIPPAGTLHIADYQHTPRSHYVEIPSNKKQHIGFQNLGNTCYMNSFLQALRTSDAFTANLFLFSKRSNSLPSDGFISTPSKVNPTLLKALQSLIIKCFTSQEEYLNLEKFQERVPVTYQNNRQHDTTEFGLDLMNELGGTQYSLLRTIFVGTLLSVVECQTCHTKSEKYELFLTLNLSIPKSDGRMQRLSSLLKQYEVKDYLQKENKYMCSTCGKKRNAEKWTEIVSPSAYLIIVLTRFQWTMDSDEKKKISDHVEIEDKIQIKSGQSVFIYELYGCIFHQGETPNSGHYYYIGRYSDSINKTQMFKFNDSKVTSLENGLETINSISRNGDAQPYALFYKCSTAPPAPPLYLPIK